MPQRIIYRKATAKHAAEGDLLDIRVGDAVTYFFNGFRTARIEQVNAKKQKLKTEALVSQEGVVLRRGRALTFEQILELHRKEDETEVEKGLDLPWDDDVG